MFTSAMLLSLWLTLAVIGLNFVVAVVQAVFSRTFSLQKFPDVLRTGILHGVFPLLVLARITPAAEWSWLMTLGYYAGAVALFAKYFSDLVSKLKKGLH